MTTKNSVEFVPDPEDAELLAASDVSPVVRGIVELMDDRFRIPGTNVRFGVDAIIGIVPVLGDIVASTLSLVVVVEALRLRAPWPTIGRMLTNLWLETAIGAIPFIGDAFDVLFKANRRNLRLLVRSLV